MVLRVLLRWLITACLKLSRARSIVVPVCMSVLHLVNSVIVDQVYRSSQCDRILNISGFGCPGRRKRYAGVWARRGCDIHSRGAGVHDATGQQLVQMLH